LNEQERRIQAQTLLQLALRTIEHDYGMSIEPVLQSEAVNSSYLTSRAVLIMKPILGWQPPVEQASAQHEGNLAATT
jgi:hypothetical protein